MMLAIFNQCGMHPSCMLLQIIWHCIVSWIRLHLHIFTIRSTKTNRFIERAIVCPWWTKLCATSVLIWNGFLFDKLSSNKVYNYSCYYGNSYHFYLTPSSNDTTCVMRDRIKPQWYNYYAAFSGCIRRHIRDIYLGMCPV